jgi:DNA-binding MurR/RpiR family transcriptional regulator
MTMAKPVLARIGPPRSVLVAIRAILPQLAPSEYRVAQVALADPTGTSAKTIGELANAARTSQATVVRLAQTLGFAGYPELRLALAASAAAEQMSGPRIVPGGDISADDNIGTVIAKIGYMDSHAVQETVDQLDQRTLRKVVDRVVAARRVDIYGVGASSIIALDLQMKLHRIGRVSFAWIDHHVAVPSAALLTRRDVAIGISHSGATQDTIDALSEAHSHAATTVALTNFPQSPITSVADLVLTTATRETTFRSGAIASRIAALTVVDCLFVAVAQRNFPATQRALERTFAAVTSRTQRPNNR